MDTNETESSRISQLIDEYRVLQDDFNLAVTARDFDRSDRLQQHMNTLLREIHAIDPKFGEEDVEKAA